MTTKRLLDFALLIHRATDKGLLLFGSAVLALIIANSKLSGIYNDLLGYSLKIPFIPQLSIHDWINDFLMAIFFLAVGLEIKREMLGGHLMAKEQRILPAVSACFGVIFPVLIYMAFNFNDKIAMKGWAIPAATDIAFALGIFAVFGKGLPVALRVFLAALAIIDDLIAVIIIALFYSGTLYWGYLIPIMLCCFLLYLLGRYKITYLTPYMAVGVFMWYCFLKSGIHSTIAGIVLGAFIPLKLSNNKQPLQRLERKLTPSVEYVILPLFALANAGINFDNLNFGSFFHPVVFGIMLGLLIGKTVGISFSVHILRKFNIISMPPNVTMKHFYYVSMLCGIGFTMSLFIALIAFASNSAYLEFAKIGVIFGSISSTIFAVVMMKIFKK
ncbi:Na+/H+ antiporter NhaA [Candidatus Bandiella euplotis]|uniref:Na(+)/H(+) antiporter NhaA n=1 Tax=Candidatus Bandiella euplotis TaxID=1664265 RepID=A0ABZ0URL6_9RICK|nr:Na+/H+ antiporter NhaA [Candidatus Bandiella woodruffii]WPX97363.1 Na(+)/H(+) antiporter NhaA [Candidatus Bandiella woodruffii]